jgi:hypothetical protein
VAIFVGLAIIIVGIPTENEALWIEGPYGRLRDMTFEDLVNILKELVVKAYVFLRTIFGLLHKTGLSFVCAVDQVWKLAKRQYSSDHTISHQQE